MPVTLSASVDASFKRKATLPLPFKSSATVPLLFKSSATLPLLVSALLLAGCSSQTTSEKSAAFAPLTSDFGQPAQAAQAPLNMAKVRNYKLYIAPIIGAPLEIVTPLSLRFDTIIKTQSITLASNMETEADYILKGYLSNLTENNQTSVLYVWDVMDKQGNRVHRLQGQEKVSGKNGWSSVPATVMGKIADDTLADYFRWVSANAP
ncbi:hypothetical protein HNQ68_002549 [Pseudochrobactrum saccharolyticum]|uniref:Lipoprotein n=1 Tax=Pseudochrobactrum saccharolyticum TaxID=354352 RepID=A0A7W8ALD3_9HYPH|nr:hypothetical protein [Pseudochrobactrum saccharolyticum]KAB0537626.1 hypothetical protein F7P81_12940 [Pseudochrobactrum saccharolyticum]MBB5092004.1 hypothetical protein [Pseudochrobactrum saccharolyticum]